ncbi:MAG: tRNA-binding protein [Bacteroidota bacterium]|jgi:tRNA-binding protein
MITRDDFERLDIRIGTILEASELEYARKPAYKLLIDFGSEGVKKSSAQLTGNYQPHQLIGKQIVAVVNFPPKQIAHFISECLVLGVVGNGTDVVLLQPERKVENGLKIA